MDSQHRHELPENDLAEALSNWRGLWAKYGTPVTLAVMLVVLAFAGMRLYGFFQTTTHESAWADLASTSSPQGFAEVADEHGVSAVKALALLRGADLYLHEAVFPPELNEAADAAGNDDASGDDAETGNGDAAGTAERDQRLARAETMYRGVLDTTDAAVFVANARLGLAAIAETREQWDDAASHYDAAEAAARAAGDTLPELAAIAVHRRSMLDQVRRPVRLASAPPSTPAPAGSTGGALEDLSNLNFDDVLDMTIDSALEIEGTIDPADFNVPAEPATDDADADAPADADPSADTDAPSTP